MGIYTCNKKKLQKKKPREQLKQCVIMVMAWERKGRWTVIHIHTGSCQGLGNVLFLQLGHTYISLTLLLFIERKLYLYIYIYKHTHTHTHTHTHGDKWTSVVMSGQHKFSVLLSEGSYSIAVFLLRWTYLVCFLNFTHLFPCGWIIDGEHSPTLWVLPLVVNKNLREQTTEWTP